MRAAVFPEMSDEEAEKLRREIISDLDSGNILIDFPEQRHVINPLRYVTDIAFIIAGMSWTVMRAPAGSEYVIGDHAVSMYDPLVGAPGESTGNGFASSPLAETVLPFDRNVAVKLSFGEDEDWRDIEVRNRLLDVRRARHNYECSPGGVCSRFALGALAAGADSWLSYPSRSST